MKLILVMLAVSMIGCASMPILPPHPGYAKPTTADSLYRIDSLERVQDIRLTRQENRFWTLLVIIGLYLLTANMDFVAK